MGLSDAKKLGDAEKLARVQLARSRSIGPVTYRTLLEKYGSAQEAIDVLLSKDRQQPLASRESAQRELDIARKLGCVTLFHGDPDSAYPALLAATEDAPPFLHTLGNVGLLKRLALAVVGSRTASAAGLKMASRLSQALSNAGIIIVSGMARGIDAAAHSASLKGGTIACMAGGVDSIYPPQNKALYAQVREQGLIISEVAPGTQATARHFPRRNRIVSGLSLGVLVIEAAEKSGSLITARLAGEQGREVFAVPGSPLDAHAAGTNQLLKDGAVLTRHVDDILDEISGLMNRQSYVVPDHIPKTSPKVQPEATDQTLAAPQNTSALLDLLSATPTHIDEIVRLLGEDAQKVQHQLQMMELDGTIARHSGGLFSKL